MQQIERTVREAVAKLGGKVEILSVDRQAPAEVRDPHIEMHAPYGKTFYPEGCASLLCYSWRDALNRIAHVELVANPDEQEAAIDREHNRNKDKPQPPARQLCSYPASMFPSGVPCDIKVERELVEALGARCPLLAKHLTAEGFAAIVTLESRTAATMYYERQNRTRKYVSGSRSLFERFNREVK